MLPVLRTAGRLAALGAFCMLFVSTQACTCILGLCSTTDAVTTTPRITLVASNLAPEVIPDGGIDISLTGAFVGGPTRATLAVAGQLPPGIRVTFSPADIREGVTTTMTILADDKAQAGRFVFDVIATEAGTSGGLTSTVQFSAQTKPPFTIGIFGSSSVTVGTSGDYTVTVNRAAGFVGAVNLSVLPSSLPAGTLVTFTPASANGNNAQLRITVPDTASAGQYLMRTVGAFGVTRDTSVMLVRIADVPVPPEITVSTSPATISIVPGGSANFDIATTKNQGTIGMGNISLSMSGVPAGANAAFTPLSAQTGTARLEVTTTSTIADGTYPITVTATLGALVRTATATLVVATPADFSLSLTPSTVTIARNASAQIALGIQRSGAVGAITMDAPTLPAGVTLTTNPAAVTGLSAALTVSVSNTAPPGTHTVVIRGTAGALARTATLTLTIPSPPQNNVSIELLGPNVSVPSRGTVKIPIKLTRTGNAVGQLLELRHAGIPIDGNAWISPSFTRGDTATLTIVGGTPGTAKIVVTAVAGAIPPSDVANVTVTPATTPDFSIIPAPQTLNALTGSFTSMAVEIVRAAGFTGAVSFQAFDDKSGTWQFRFSLTQTTGSAVGFEIAPMSNVPDGPHLITIRATSGSIVREVTMTVVTAPGSSYPTYPYYPYGLKKPPL